MLHIFQFFTVIIIAGVAGHFISKLKLPSILGWLITGMILGPHAVGLLEQDILNSMWYQSVVHVLECTVGLMIGTELVLKKLKQAGKSILITTLTQSLGTFLIVSVAFGITFYFFGYTIIPCTCIRRNCISYGSRSRSFYRKRI